MNVSSSNVLDGSTDSHGTTHIVIITVSVLLSAVALCVLIGVLYMALRTGKKRAADRPPQEPRNENGDDKLRNFRLSLAFGDMEPKVPRELVTMRTDNYDVHGNSSNKDGQGAKKLPLKCHL